MEAIGATGMLLMMHCIRCALHHPPDGFHYMDESLKYKAPTAS
jgi:hypothetical protein